MNTNPTAELNEITTADLEVFGYELRGDALVRAMERVAQGMRRHLESAIDNVPGGMGAWWVLHHLDRYGRQPQVDIARSLGITSSTLAQRLKRMEEAGLITRTPDEYDPRRMMVALSERGVVECREQRECADAEVARLVEGAECWDIDALRRVLRVVQDNLHKLDKDPNRPITHGGHPGAGEK
jgi:DNA-binding MarR family transcriptional regulator